MAKIKFGMMMTDARGKLGGQVFSKNRSGAYVRTKVSPVNAQTARQTFVRSLLSSISQAWSGLTQEVRAGFDGAVAQWSTTDVFGDIKNPTGKNLFTRLNINLVNAGLAQITDVPDKLDVPSFGDFVAEDDTGALALSGFPVDANARLVVFATAPQSAGTSYYKGKYRQIGSYPVVTSALIDITSDYVAKFGAYGDPDNISIEAKLVMPNGQTGVANNVRVTYV